MAERRQRGQVAAEKAPPPAVIEGTIRFRVRLNKGEPKPIEKVLDQIRPFGKKVYVGMSDYALERFEFDLTGKDTDEGSPDSPEAAG